MHVSISREVQTGCGFFFKQIKSWCIFVAKTYKFWLFLKWLLFFFFLSRFIINNQTENLYRNKKHGLIKLFYVCNNYLFIGPDSVLECMMLCCKCKLYCKFFFWRAFFFILSLNFNGEKCLNRMKHSFLKNHYNTYKTIMKTSKLYEL